MDITAITFADGLALTAAKFEAEFLKISGHQITALDMADGFNWGTDLPLGGFGILAARHLNGTILDARYFIDGNDEEAIQAAVYFAAATSSTSGIVMIPKRSSAWTFSSTVVVSGGITIIGDPHGTDLSLDSGTHCFTVASGATDVVFENLVVDGNTNTGGLVLMGGNTDRVTVKNCQIGTEGAASTTYADGNMVEGGTYTCDHLRIEDCTMYGGGGLVSIDGGKYITITGNKLLEPGQTSAKAVWIDLNGCDHCRIADNYGWLYESGNTMDRAVHLNNCDYWRLSDNEFWGGSLSQILIEDCLYGRAVGNRFMHGGTAGTLYESYCVLVKNASHKNVFDGNTITCVSDLSGTIPLCTHGIVLGDATFHGATVADDNTVVNNFFSSLTDGASPTVGEFRFTTAGVSDYPTTTCLNGNTYFQMASVLHTLTGGATTEAITFPGINSITHVQMSYEGATVEDFRMSGITNNTVTVALSTGAGNITAGGKIYLHATNDY